MERVILHCDLNNFFASVECLSHPEYRDVPIAVAGSKEDRHGIILAKNELAKVRGVVTAEAIWQAERKCPGLVLVPPHYEDYARLSRMVTEIYLEYTDQVEPFSIDECWLDVTGSRTLFGDGEHIAHTIRNRVKNELGLTVSIGVSFNKVFAKLGSDYKKPDAVTVISRENYRDILFPLPVNSLLFVGKSTVGKLNTFGIKTIGDLAGCDKALLTDLLGSHGETLYTHANGLDKEPVRRFDEEDDPKSVGKGITFRRSLICEDEVRIGVVALSDNVAARLRKRNMWCNCVQITIKDDNLHSINRQKKLPSSTNLARDICDAAMGLVTANWSYKIPIRMITVTACDLTGSPRAVQMSLFDAPEPDERAQAIEHSMDDIRSRFGKGAVQFGTVLGNDIGVNTGEKKEKTDED